MVVQVIRTFTKKGKTTKWLHEREQEREQLKLVERGWEGGGNKGAEETVSESDFIRRDETTITFCRGELGHCWQFL